MCLGHTKYNKNKTISFTAPMTKKEVDKINKGHKESVKMFDKPILGLKPEDFETPEGVRIGKEVSHGVLEVIFDI